MSRVVILYGPPGGGKGTQANLLAHLKGFYHFDTGQYIEELVHNPRLKNDRIIQRERKLFDSGILCTPSWVIQIVKDKIQTLKKAELNVVFSGSPRTFYEAFGDKSPTQQTEGLISFLKTFYGKDNIFIFLLKIKPQTSLKRNTSRLICSLCGQPLMYLGVEIKSCPFCGGELRTRTLDKPEIIKTRLDEYKNRTSPIFTGLKQEGYKINEVNGEPMPGEVFKNIIKVLKQ